MIYSVTFHVNPKKKVHTFWFTDKETASKFLESVQRYPKTIDSMMLQVPVSEETEYDGEMEEGRVLPVQA